MPDSNNQLRAITVADLAFPPREGGYAKGHETREQILHAALDLLVEQGYRAMSMRRVAAACGMKLGNLTYHFPTREDLVRELLAAVISAYEIEFALIVDKPGVPPEERLRDVCQLILEDIRSRKTTRVFPELWALSNHDPFVFERVQELYQRARAPLIEIVAEMRPDLDSRECEDLALFISASMEGTTVFAGHEKPFEPRMAALERIAIQSFLQVVRSYRRA
jgi:AcrR family transcriptional regulator